MSKSNANFPRFPFLDKIDIDQDVKSRLSINLSRIYSGSDEIFTTPLGKSSDVILREWDSVFQRNKSKLNSTLYDIELSQKSKYGPRSIAKPWKEREPNVLEYFEKSKVRPVDLGFRPNPKDVGLLRPISLSNALKLLKNNTNSGLPFFTRKGKVKHRVLAELEEIQSKNYPCVLFTRTQEQGKTRDVWGYPIGDTLLEMRFYSPLLGYQKKLFWRSALRGPDEVNKHITKIIITARKKGLVLISIDFFGYDRSLKPWGIRQTSLYIKDLFQKKFWTEIDDLIERLINIPLVTPSDIKEGEHCLPSGATPTNEIGSIFQGGSAEASGAVEGDLFDVQGDDGVYAVKPENVKKLLDGFERVGLRVNKDKTFQSYDYLVYLQNLYHIDYIKDGLICGIYPVYRALNRLLFQERWSGFEDYGIEGKDYYSIRAISILENCKHHPLFEEFVTFIFKMDKYQLRYSSRGLAQYLSYLSETSGTEGILINQYGDDVKGIKSFETVKLLNRLRQA